MESNGKRGGLISVLAPKDSNKEIFKRQIATMMKPYIEAAFTKLNPSKMKSGAASHRETIDAVEELLLEDFWAMSQQDAQISLMMIPIMAYLKKADRKATKA